MNKKKKQNPQQQYRSILALVFVALFLITGKLFVWKNDPKASTPQNGNASAEMTPATTTTVTTTTTTETTTTTTTTTAMTDHFETYPPEYFSSLEASLTDSVTELTESETTVTTVTEVTETEPVTDPAPAAAPADYFNDALFIGDSRTVGMACYAPIDGATYFATVGLSTYKIDDAQSEVPGTEGMTFAQVLSMKQYGKIYIMLGINELGNDFNTTMENYRGIIARVQAAQPNAIVILEANLHVSAARHNSDAIVNNTVINNFNAALAAMADNNTIYYIDVNPVFDDAYGCLTAEYTSDGTHPYAKHYLTWADWLRENAIIK